MKKIAFTLIITLFSVFSFGQDLKSIKEMSPEQRREYVKNLSPEQKQQLLHKFRENMLLQQLNIPDNKKEAFLTLFKEYMDSQKQIKDKFRPNKKADQLSEAEAKQQLNQSFEIGQQLLNNRKAYAEKFLKFLTPQQVLKLFRMEGNIRQKLMEKRNGPPPGKSMRGPAPEEF